MYKTVYFIGFGALALGTGYYLGQNKETRENIQKQYDHGVKKIGETKDDVMEKIIKGKDKK